jgi:hypothetical protein
LKYNAPVSRELPSLSVDGSELFAPKYLSSKLSKELAAAVAELAAFDACVEAVEALDAAAVAEFAAAVALDAAFVAEVVADEASTSKEYFAEFALDVNGWLPLLV